MKKRVSLTISEKVLREVDNLVDGLLVRSRSDAVERILKEHVIERKTAVILAGGKPENMLLEGTDVYKPLADIGKRKLIEDNLIRCRESGFVNIIIVGSPLLISKFYETLGNGEKYGVNVTYIEENRMLGSAKTLELAKNYIKTDFLFLPCDFFIGFDLEKLFEFHMSTGGIVTIGVHTRTTYDWKKGIVDLDGHNIKSYEESPKKPKTRLVGIFAGFMKPDVFNYIPPGDVYWSLQENVFPKLASEGKLMGYPIAADWVNVHTESDVEKVINLRKKTQ